MHLSGVRPSVRPSVPCGPPHAAAADLLLRARRATAPHDKPIETSHHRHHYHDHHHHIFVYLEVVKRNSYKTQT